MQRMQGREGMEGRWGRGILSGHLCGLLEYGNEREIGEGGGERETERDGRRGRGAGVSVAKEVGCAPPLQPETPC